MEDKEQTWIKNYWRPMMAYQYLVVCLFDFIIAPLAVMAMHYYTGSVYVQWDPLTLKESAFYHISMAAIIGVSAWTRGMEKIKQITVDTTNSTTSDNIENDK